MSPQIESLKAIFSELFSKLMTFCLEEDYIQYLGESLEVFYNLQEGEEYEFDPTEEFLFLSWFLLDDEDPAGNSLVDEFMHRYNDELTLQEMQICKALKGTHLTLLQVQDVVPKTSLKLKDIFLGEEFEVNEAVGEVTSEVGESESDSLKGNLLYTRVLRLGEARFLVGAGVFLDPSVTEALTTFVTDQFKQDCEDGHHTTFKEFLKGNGELMNWWIRAYEKGDLSENALVDTADSPEKKPGPKVPPGPVSAS